MLRKALRSPILFDTTMGFLIDTECFEGMQVLARKYPFSDKYVDAIKTCLASQKTDND